MSSPFDIVNNILQEKESVTDLTNFVPYITNRAISYHYDCIMQANEMNMHTELHPEMQYSFLFNSIRKYKRPFRKWQKKEKEESISIIKEYYGISSARARDFLTVLSEENIDFMRERNQKGGMTK